MLKGDNSMDYCYQCLQVQKNYISFAALKQEREKGGEKEKETDLKLEKTFQSPWTPCRICSQQVT